MTASSVTRRTVSKTAALAPPAFAASSLTAPFARWAYAAGNLSMGTCDHWVPGASQVLQKICMEWAEKAKVELVVDLVMSNGDKDLLTLMAEGQAKAGHDIMACATGTAWLAQITSSRCLLYDEAGGDSMPKRELIDTGTDKRYVRRDAKGRFKEADDVGKSLATDVRQAAKTKVKPGQGDKGDQKRSDPVPR